MHSREDRGISPILGAILLAAILVLALAAWQVNVVPQQDRDVEFAHYRAVREDLKELRSEVISSAGTGSIRSVTIDVGLVYPQRFILASPSPATGTIAARPLGKIEASGFNVSETCGLDPPVTTSYFYYQPHYARSDVLPYQLEHSLLYVNANASTEASDIVVSDQALISGDTIYLYVIKGTFQRTTADSVTVDLKAAPVTGVNKSPVAPVWINLTTKLSEDSWIRTLTEVNDVEAINETKGIRKSGGMIRIPFEGADYTIRCSVIGTKSQPDPDPDQVIDGGDLGPKATDLEVTPVNVTRGGTFDLTATITDVGRGGDNVVGAEWFRDGDDPGTGNANAMVVVDGLFDSSVEDVKDLNIDTDGWSLGTHNISVRGEDGAGNWGDVTNVTVRVKSKDESNAIQGVVYKGENNGNLKIYNYSDGTITNTGVKVGKAVGGIGDWDGDGNVSDVAYIRNSQLKIYDHDDGTATTVVGSGPTQVKEVVGFFGDFDLDNNEREVPFRNNSKNLLVARPNASAGDGVDIITVKRISTGGLLTLKNGPQHVTGTADIDRDGDPEFAYVNENEVLAIAHLVRFNETTDTLFVRIETVDHDQNENMKGLGAFGDLDDDEYYDDVPIDDNNQRIEYYDYTRDYPFLYSEDKRQSLGGVIDTDGDGVQRLYYVGEDGNLRFKEADSTSSKTATDEDGDPVTADKVGGAN